MAESKKIEKPREKATVKVSVKEVTVGKAVVKETVAKPNPKITNVYSADFSVIDQTIEDIKKTCRSVGKDSYSCNNLYIILEDALKKCRLAYR
jgi:organic hydroperoxide reductase OsmC/OhrA